MEGKHRLVAAGGRMLHSSLVGCPLQTICTLLHDTPTMQPIYRSCYELRHDGETFIDGIYTIEANNVGDKAL